MEARNIKENILKLYYEEHMKAVDIAKVIGRTSQYISKITKQDSRYENEKKNRHIQSLEKKKAYNREYYKTYERKKDDRELYDKLLATINRDNEILSTKTEISDIDFVRCNRSAYEYAKNSSNLVLKKEINATFDVPKVVSNIVHASCIGNSKIYV